MHRLFNIVLPAMLVFPFSAMAQTEKVQPGLLPAETLFRLTNVTIGKQSFLLIVPVESSRTDDGSIPDSSLATLLNFFLEVPVPAEK